MRRLEIFACIVSLILGSAALARDNAYPVSSPPSTLLKLPQLTDLEVPSVGPPLDEPRIAITFFGCWMGTPGKFDSILPGSSANSLYRLHRVTKCYLPGQVRTQEFALELAPKHRILRAILSFLSLASYNAAVQSEKSNVYKVTPNQVYSRGTLTMQLTESSLFKFPTSTTETVVDEEVATLLNPDTLSVVGRTFLTGTEARSVGTWHAELHH